VSAFAIVAGLTAISVNAQTSPSAIGGIKIRNFGQMDTNYFRGAQPEKGDYQALKDLGITTIIDLQEKPTNYEKSSAEALGMKCINIPMNDAKYPAETSIATFLKEINDPANGKELWRANGLNPDNNPSYRIVASPIVFDDIIYAPTRIKPLLALKAGGRGDITSSHVLWSTANGPDVPTPVTDGKYFYVVNDRGVMFCLDAKTGAEVYANQRIKPGTYSGSPVLADGKIYITNEDGLTTVVAAGPKFEVLAENPLNDYVLSSPAISDGQLFIRTAQHLYAIGKK